MENNDEGNFVVFTNEFNQSTEKSSEMANIFNFLSKDDKNFSISININDNLITIENELNVISKKEPSIAKQKICNNECSIM